MRPHSLAVLMFLPAVFCFAADNTKQRADAPLVGYSFSEQSRELRAILGVPGATRWSDSLPLPQGATMARIAPGQQWALVSLENGQTGILTLDTLAYQRLDFEGAFDAVEFSPTGSAIALRLADGSTVIFEGLPASPKQKSATAVAAEARISVSDTGSLLIVSEGRLLRNSEFVAECSDECRFAYFPGSDAFAVFAAGRLLEFNGEGSSRVIAEGLDPAALLAASAKTLLLADPGSLRVVDRESGAVMAKEDAPAAIARLDRLRQSGNWMLSVDDPGSASWMYSPEGIRFVPARTAVSEVKE